MKRKKTNLILCSLVLLAALLAEAYCFLEFRGDILTILGTGVIVIAAAFMTLDSFLSMFGTGGGDSAKSDEIKVLQKHIAEMEKVQKATFVILKKSAAKEQETITRITAQIEQQREIIVKTGKLIAKYDRENALRLEALLRKISERPDFDDTGLLLSLGTANQNLEKMAADFGKLKGSLEGVHVAPAAMAQAAVEEEPIMQVEDMAETVAAEPEIAAEPEPVVESAAEPEPEPAPAAPEIDMSDPNKMMSPDDIAALLSSMEAAPAAEPEPEPEPAPAAPEIDMSDPNKMMSPDDIAALLSSMEAAPAAEPEPEPEPAPAAPEIDMSDPNKMMSPDDIAALLASMGQ